VTVAEANPERPWWRPWAEANLGAIQLQLGSLNDAILHLERGRKLATEDDERIQQVRCTSHLAWALWLAGEPSQASAHLADGLQALAGVRAPAGRVWLAGIDAYDSAARVLQAAGRTDDVRSLLAPLLPPARGSGWHEVRATVTLRLAASAGRDCRNLLEEALASARAGGLRPLEGEAHLALATLLASSGREEEARVHSEAWQRIARAVVPPSTAETTRAGW
jgi:hypothetical protein